MITQNFKIIVVAKKPTAKRKSEYYYFFSVSGFDFESVTEQLNKHYEDFKNYFLSENYARFGKVEFYIENIP